MSGITPPLPHPNPIIPLRSNSTQAPITLSSLENIGNSQLWEEKLWTDKGQKWLGSEERWKPVSQWHCPKWVNILYTSFKEASFSLNAMGLVLFSTIPYLMSHFLLFLVLEHLVYWWPLKNTGLNYLNRSNLCCFRVNSAIGILVCRGPMVVLCGFSTSQEVGAPILVLFKGQLYDCLGYVPKKKTAEREKV